MPAPTMRMGVRVENMTRCSCFEGDRTGNISVPFPGHQSLGAPLHQRFRRVGLSPYRVSALLTTEAAITRLRLPQDSDLFPWLSPFGLTSSPKPLWVRDPLDDYAAYGLQLELT